MTSPIDFTHPQTSDNYATAFVPAIIANQLAQAMWLDSNQTSYTAGLAQYMKRFNSTSGLFEQYNGTAWATLPTNYAVLNAPNNFSSTMVVNGYSILGNQVTQAAPSATAINTTAAASVAGNGGNGLWFGQNTGANSFISWIQASYINPTTAVYGLALQPLGGNVGINTGNNPPLNTLVLNSLTSSNIKIALQDAGVNRGYIAATAALSFGAVNSANTLYTFNVDQVGNSNFAGNVTSAGGIFNGPGTGYFQTNNANWGAIYRPSNVGSTNSPFGQPNLHLWTNAAGGAAMNLDNSFNLYVSGNLTSAGVVTATTSFVISGSTGQITKNASQGLLLQSIVGSALDFCIVNPANSAYLMAVPTGTQNVQFYGNVSTSGSISATGTVAASGIVGRTNGVAAAAGTIGEFLTAQASATVNNTVSNLVTLVIPAGDWDVTGSVYGASTTSLVSGLSTTSATLPAAPYSFYIDNNIAITLASTVPTIRINSNTSTTLYLAVLSGSSTTGTGVIEARRVS